VKVRYSVYRDGLIDMHRGKSDVNIPKIIHQTWKNYDVPERFVRDIRSWLEKNPDWDYWLWTDRDAYDFIKLKFPKFHPIYKEYAHYMQRVDAMRYFVLHEFGGWYSDLDVRVLRPLEEISRKHYCMVPLEPWGQAILTWNRARLSSNAVMAASPRHPFIKRVIRTLPSLAKRRGAGAMLWSTGPFMIEGVITTYESEGKKSTTRYFQNETVWLANPEHFLPVADGSAVSKWKQMCSRRKSLNKLQKDYCDSLKRTRFSNDLPKDAYTTHGWAHTYFGYSKKKTKNIFNVVPRAKNVSKMIKRMANGR
jgi:mannosyltransferase OCH1-like enzyme